MPPSCLSNHDAPLTFVRSKVIVDGIQGVYCAIFAWFAMRLSLATHKQIKMWDIPKPLACSFQRSHGLGGSKQAYFIFFFILPPHVAPSEEVEKRMTCFILATNINDFLF
jgi:hypothetical protein